MASSVVSLRPPLYALVRGVRRASVMTTSSGFLVVLKVMLVRVAPSFFVSPLPLHMYVVASTDTYIADSPLVEGVICDTMDLRRSVILAVLCEGELRLVERRGRC
jgi:hypothetical protein